MREVGGVRQELDTRKTQYKAGARYKEDTLQGRS